MLINSILSSLPPTLPRREAELLLAHLLGQSRTWVSAHPAAEVNNLQHVQYQEMLGQLKRGTPLPYVLGEWEFFGLRFRVTPDVLIPRPETELLVETAISGRWIVNSKSLPTTHYPLLTIADVGTGSGIIAITLATKLPHTKLFATDISGEALQVAQENAKRHGVSDRLTFVRGDLLEGVGQVNMICANLPYIPTQELATLEVSKHEPRLALDGGDDGLRLMERLLATAPGHLLPHGVILAEIEATQRARVLALAHKYFPEAPREVKKDLATLNRLLVIQT